MQTAHIIKPPKHVEQAEPIWPTGFQGRAERKVNLLLWGHWLLYCLHNKWCNVTGWYTNMILDANIVSQSSSWLILCGRRRCSAPHVDLLSLWEEVLRPILHAITTFSKGTQSCIKQWCTVDIQREGWLSWHLQSLRASHLDSCYNENTQAKTVFI